MGCWTNQSTPQYTEHATSLTQHLRADMISEEQLAEYERLRKVSIDASLEFSKYRTELAKICQHPEKYVEPYRWEHDNGYGSQHYVTGKACTICYAKDYHNSGYWSQGV